MKSSRLWKSTKQPAFQLLAVFLAAVFAATLVPTPASARQGGEQAKSNPTQLPEEVRKQELAKLAPKEPVPGEANPDPKHKSLADESQVSPAAQTEPESDQRIATFRAAAIAPGSITSSGPLTQIGTTPDLNCSLNHAGDTAGEYFGNTACATMIVVGSTLYGPANIPAGGGASPRTAFSPVSQTASGSGTASDPYILTTVADAGTTGVRVTQTDTYVTGQETYRTDVKVSNTSASAQSYRLYRAFDCYRADSDHGYGTASTASGAVGCVASANIPTPLLQLSPITAGSAFYEASYSQVWAAIGAQMSFSNTCRCNEYIDNGAGLSWSGSIAAQANTTFSFRTEASLGTPVGGPITPQQTYGSSNPSMNYQPCSATRHPINCATGNFWHEFDDIGIAGRGPSLGLTRAYNALDADHDSEFGYGWSSNVGMSLDLSGPVVTIRQENGSVVEFTDDGSGNFTAPPRFIATLTHNTDGSWTFLRRNNQTFTFDANGVLISVADRNGYATTYTRPNATTLVETDSAGRSITFTRTDGRITSLVGPVGRTMSFTYDTAGNLTDVIQPDGGHWQFTYDGDHRMLTMREPKFYGDTTTTPSPVITNVYDGQSRVTSQTDQLGRQTTLSYNSDGTTVITDPLGNVETQRYVQGELVELRKGVGSPNESTWTYTYDQATLGVATETDPNGHVESYTYDVNGNTISTTDALGNTSTATYNEFNQPLTVTDPNGVTTTMTYDSAGNLLSSSTPVGGSSSTTTLTYGNSAQPGDVTKVTDPNGKTTTFTYNANGDVALSTDAVGNKTAFAYNTIGRLTSKVDPKGNVPGANAAQFTTSFEYDQMGRMTTVKDPLWNASNPTAHRITTTYDLNGIKTSSIDGNGNTTTFTFNAANEPIATTKPNGVTQQMSYYADGSIATQTDGNGKVTNYTYDRQGRMTSSTDALGRTTTFTYDPAGNVSSKVDPGGSCSGTAVGCTTFDYDAADRLIGVDYSDDTADVSYTYDNAGQRLSMTDGTGTTANTWDNLGRLTSQTNGAGATVGYAYDNASNLTAITYPGNNTVTRTFDAANRMTSVKDWLGKTTRFTYDPNSNMTSVLSANGVANAATFDNANQLNAMQIAKGSAANLSYTRSGNGSLSSSVSTGALSQAAENYGYDQNNRLTSVNANPITYDNADNITKTLDGATQTYDNASQLTSRTLGATTTTFGYDARGNRTSQTTGGQSTTFGYDQANRLKAFTSPATSASYAYDGDGNRASKTVNGTTDAFVYNQAEGLSQILSDGTNSYIYGPGGMPIEQINGTTVTYLHQDQLGSTRVLTDASRNVVGTYGYDAYGKTSAKTGTAETPLQYAGQYVDAESGMYWMRARYYDPTTAQFVSRDPIASITREPYSYVAGDPLNATDPSGLWCPLGKNPNGRCRGSDPVNVIKVVHDVSGVVAGVAAVCAVATSWTIVGGVSCGTVAGVAGAVNVGTSIGLWATNNQSATTLALDVASAGVGKGASSLARAGVKLEQASAVSYREASELFGNLRFRSAASAGLRGFGQELRGTLASGFGKFGGYGTGLWDIGSNSLSLFGFLRRC